MNSVKITFLGALVTAALLSTGGAALAKDDHKFRVPPGHMPPAGKCRIWYPGTPPGRQPPPGECWVLSRKVPRGAWLIGHNRRWGHSELGDRRFRHSDFRGSRYLGRKEIYREIREVRQARREVQENREQLKKSYEELRKDRADLKKDIRSGASRKEIAEGRREIRQNLKEIAENKRELRQSQDKLRDERQDLKDLRRR